MERDLVPDSKADLAVIDKGNCTLQGALSMVVGQRKQIVTVTRLVSVHMKLTWQSSLTQLLWCPVQSTIRWSS